MKPILVIEQEPRLAGHGVLGERLRARELPVRDVRAWREDLTLLDPSEFAAVIPLGSNLSAWQEDAHPFLGDERRLLERSLDTHTPVLGICLGAQLLARAAGADVYAGGQPEIGWLPISITPGAALDPLFADANGSTAVYQFHLDTFGLPPGAVRLASSEAYPNQAFRLGNAWGVQFHPEVDFRQSDIWLGNHPGYCEKIGIDEAALRASVRSGFAEHGEFSRQLIDRFLDLVRAGSR
jgi:GMP synthase (glutamine-hydrolysing)